MDQSPRRRRILCNQNSALSSDRQASIRPSGEFGARNAPKPARRPCQTGHQFGGDPCTGATGLRARKPFGGSVSHSRSGSGPSGSALFPIPTQFNGFKLRARSTSIRRSRCTSPRFPPDRRREPSRACWRETVGCSANAHRLARRSSSYPLPFARAPSCAEFPIYRPVGIDGRGGAGRRQFHFWRHDDLPVLAIVNRRRLVIETKADNRTDNRTKSLPGAPSSPAGKQELAEARRGHPQARSPRIANQSPSPYPLPSVIVAGPAISPLISAIQ